MHALRIITMTLLITLVSCSTQHQAARKVLVDDPFTPEPAAGWSWIREDPAAWMVEDGELLLRVLPGYIYSDDDNAPNLLLREVPETSAFLVIEVFLRNQPVEEYEHAALVWYYDDDNYICHLKEQMGGDDGILLRYQLEQDAESEFIGERNYEPEGVWFRIDIKKNKAAGFFRNTDKEPWNTMGEFDLPVTGKPRLGVFAGGGVEDAERWAKFSSFRVLEQTE